MSMSASTASLVEGFSSSAFSAFSAPEMQSAKQLRRERFEKTRVLRVGPTSFSKPPKPPITELPQYVVRLTSSKCWGKSPWTTFHYTNDLIIPPVWWFFAKKKLSLLIFVWPWPFWPAASSSLVGPSPSKSGETSAPERTKQPQWGQALATLSDNQNYSNKLQHLPQIRSMTFSSQSHQQISSVREVFKHSKPWGQACRVACIPALQASCFLDSIKTIKTLYIILIYIVLSSKTVSQKKCFLRAS